jgi:hypothetical protein
VAVIYLQHPQYGTKVAISDSEADYDERNGWARYNPDELEVAVNALEVKRKYTRRAVAEGV